MAIMADTAKAFAKIQRLNGFGKVELILGEGGQFSAKAYLPHFRIGTEVRRRIESGAQTTFTLDEISNLQNEVRETPIAMATRCKTPIDALTQLAERLDALKKLPNAPVSA